MNDASTVPIVDVLDAQTEPDSELGSGSRLALYFAVGLGAGSVIALQIDVMRVFSVGVGPRPYRSLCSGRSRSALTFMCSIWASTRSS
jgi:hypothetical protein